MKSKRITGQPHPVDIHVGRMVREARNNLGISQTELGAQLGITFQQVQKYERGTNRISASALWQISQFLGVPVEDFFKGLSVEKKSGKSSVSNLYDEVMNKKTVRELVRNYLGLPSPKQQLVSELVKQMR